MYFKHASYVSTLSIVSFFGIVGQAKLSCDGRRVPNKWFMKIIACIVSELQVLLQVTSLEVVLACQRITWSKMDAFLLMSNFSTIVMDVFRLHFC